jgi:hypothetical protein
MLHAINWITVLVAAAAGYFFGALWFMPGLFGNAWLRALGKNREALGNPTQPMIVTAFTTLLTAMCLAVILKGCSIDSLVGGVAMGVVIGGGIVFATMLSDGLFQGQPMKLVWICGGHRFASIVLMCAIIGAI